MRLADDTLALSIAGETIELRPSLRAATRLEAEHGLDQLARAICAGSVTAVLAVLKATALDPDRAIAAVFGGQGYQQTLDQTAPQLVALIEALAGHDPDAKRSPAKTSDQQQPKPLGEHFRQLYRYATGALGWTPRDAWAATPLEIIEAYSGRVDLLNALFGDPKKAKKADTDKPKPSLAEQVRYAFAGKATRKEDPACPTVPDALPTAAASPTTASAAPTSKPGTMPSRLHPMPSGQPHIGEVMGPSGAPPAPTTSPPIPAAPTAEIPQPSSITSPRTVAT